MPARKTILAIFYISGYRCNRKVFPIGSGERQETANCDFSCRDLHTCGGALQIVKVGRRSDPRQESRLLERRVQSDVAKHCRDEAQNIVERDDGDGYSPSGTLYCAIEAHLGEFTSLNSPSGALAAKPVTLHLSPLVCFQFLPWRATCLRLVRTRFCVVYHQRIAGQLRVSTSLPQSNVPRAAACILSHVDWD